MKSVSIIIPAHNEGSRLGKTLNEYINYFSQLGEKFEIIVVCDGCQDSTPRIAQGFARKSNRVCIINIPQQIGKGGAIKEGLRLVSGDVCLFVDADGSTSAAESLKLILAVSEGTDIAIASRKLRGSTILRKQRLARRIAAWGFNRLVHLLFGLPFTDTQCGAKAFTKKVIGPVLSKVTTNGFAFDVDLLWTLKKNRYQIQEVPITWRDSGGSKVALHKAIPRIFIEVLRLRLRGG